VRVGPILRKLVVPLLCAAAGGAAGWLLHATRSPSRVVQVREGGHHLVNPLIACELGPDLIQSEELVQFQRKIEAHLQDAAHLPGVEAVSVYFHELNDGIWFVLGEHEVYSPASLHKVPMLIAMLKQAERDPELLARTVRFTLKHDYAADQTFKPSQTLVSGQAYAVGDLLRRMIVFSDNNAFMVVGGLVDPRELERVYELLDLPGGGDGRAGEFRSVSTYASFFRILYNASYLGADLSERALALLAESEFRSGIVEGVPASVPVAHKFGEHRDEAAGRVELHDCGIVYVPQHPYLLCVMTRGRSFEYLDDAIASTSRAVWSEVAGTHGGR
jgi:beta-lactamase class A